MNKIKTIVIVLFIGLQGLYAAEDWGKTGHRATGEVAQKYLSKKARKEINKLLNGHTLAFVANYADDIKSDSLYDRYYAWHYVNFPSNSTYETHPKSSKGDLMVGITTCIEMLKSEKSTKEEKVFHLKMLVHFIGDLHQPLHVGKAKDRGGNDIQVSWFKESTNLHRVWDYHMIDDYEMSYTEFANNANQLTKLELKQYQEGTVFDWMHESRKLCEEVYDNTEVGEKLSYRYLYDNMNIVRSQIQKGGIRLAVLLNDIFE